MPESQINVGINPGSAAHPVLPDQGDPEPERRRFPAPVNVAVGGGTPGLPGIYGIVGQLTAFAFVLYLSWSMYRDNTTNTRELIAASQRQSDLRDTILRDEMRAAREATDRRDAATLAAFAGMQSRMDAAVAESRTSRVALETLATKIEALLVKFGGAPAPKPTPEECP